MPVPSHCKDRLIRKIIWARLLANTEQLEPVASQLPLVSHGHPEITLDILLRHDDGTQHDAGKSKVRYRHTHKAGSQAPPAQCPTWIGEAAPSILDNPECNPPRE